MRSLTTLLFTLLLAGCPAPQTLGDEDCVDCDDTSTETDTITCYPDLDGDGYGNGNYPDAIEGAECPEGQADNGYDWCDDNDRAWRYDDCYPDGMVDADGDGYNDSADCDDMNAAIHPGAVETCNGIDDDCDGVTDESSAMDADTWYLDDDEDGYGDSAETAVACDQPSSYVTDGNDCDDTDDDINPSETEICGNGVDEDCDGMDDTCAVTDHDGDGYDEDEDCDDADATRFEWVELLINGDFEDDEDFETYPVVGEDWGVEGDNADADELSIECDTAGNCYVVLEGDSTTMWSGDQLAQDINLDDLDDGDPVKISFEAKSSGISVYSDSVQFIEDVSPWSALSDRGTGTFYADSTAWTEFSVEDEYEAASSYSGDGRFSIHFSSLTSGEELWIDNVSFEVCQ